MEQWCCVVLAALSCNTRDEVCGTFCKSLHLTHMEPKRLTELLTRTAVQLVSGKELIREKKKMMKKAKDPLVVSNTKHQIETVSKAVEGLKQHRHLLKKELAKIRAAS
jgi:hypothetical protein